MRSALYTDPFVTDSYMDANGFPQFPGFQPSQQDPFLKKVERTGKKWVVLTDRSGEPHMVLNSDGFLRSAIFHDEVNPNIYVHRPIIVKDPQTPLGNILGMFKVEPQYPGDDVVDHDIILVGGEDRRVITAADLPGRRLRGIVKPAHG